MTNVKGFRTRERALALSRTVTTMPGVVELRDGTFVAAGDLCFTSGGRRGQWVHGARGSVCLYADLVRDGRVW